MDIHPQHRAHTHSVSHFLVHRQPLPTFGWSPGWFHGGFNCNSVASFFRLGLDSEAGSRELGAGSWRPGAGYTVAGRIASTFMATGGIYMQAQLWRPPVGPQPAPGASSVQWQWHSSYVGN